MQVFRISQQQFATDLTGKGAELFGGRWNSIGEPMLYTAENRSLCVVEIAVHTPLGVMPVNYQLVTIDVPESSIKHFRISDLPKNWNMFPHPPETQAIGDEFLKDQNYFALRVPSAAVPQEANILINPKHKLAHKIKVSRVEPFEFDCRLFS